MRNMAKKSTPTGLTEQFKGATIAEYSDGSWRYTGDNGKTKGSLARKPAWLTSFNKETALEAHDAKKTLRQNDAEIGVMRAMSGMSPHKIRTGHEGMQFIYERQAELAASPDVKGSTGAAKFVAESFYGGPPQDKEIRTITVNIDNATLQAIQQVEDRNVIEGDFVEQD